MCKATEITNAHLKQLTEEKSIHDNSQKEISARDNIHTTKSLNYINSMVSQQGGKLQPR